MLTEQHLDKLANQIVDQFFNEKTALTDGVVQTAQEENLNPEQVKRLVESVNNLTFLKKFSSTQGPDRMVEFETASSNAAIQRMLDTAGDLMKGASIGNDAYSVNTDLSSDLPLTRPDAPEPLEAEKIASTEEPPISQRTITHTILKLRKTAEYLAEQKYQKRVQFTDDFQKLATHFTRARGPAFEQFEKDAFYQWGDAAGPFLQTLRGSLRMAPAEYDHSTFTKVARVVDTQTPEIRLLRGLLDNHNEIHQIECGQEKIAEYLEKLNAR
jgi:hypothetical protein